MSARPNRMRGFTRWTILEEAPRNRWGYRMVKARCACGTVRVIVRANIANGVSKSCGCYRAESSTARAIRHGHCRTRSTRSPTYLSWVSMTARCNNPKDPFYANYGGRGIRVCKRWRSFENFLSDMGERPTGLSLDRIDNDGDYKPGNCRWATTREQGRNKSTNCWLTHAGRTATLSEWAESTGLLRTTIQNRLRRGDSVADALRPISQRTARSRVKRRDSERGREPW